MRKPFFVACLFGFMMGVLLGCSATDKTEETAQSSSQTSAANVATNPEGKQLQYRAVCLEKAAHGGNEQVLSRWLDEKDKAEELGKYHGDFKEKGHRWRLEERTKPEQAQPK